MGRASSLFEKAIKLLADHYGLQEGPPCRDPLGLVLWENVGYLVSDDRRREAFEMLCKSIGADADSILRAKREKLYEVAALGGMLPEMRLEKLLTIARIARDEFGGQLQTVVKRPFAEAKKALKLFPSIGEPGAEKILLFSRAYPVMALESNGLRVLVRLGYGREHKNYSATYRAVLEALKGQYKEDPDHLIQAHLLLRKHGQDLCRRTQPVCPLCPLSRNCNYYNGLNSGG